MELKIEFTAADIKLLKNEFEYYNTVKGNFLKGARDLFKRQSIIDYINQTESLKKQFDVVLHEIERSAKDAGKH